MTPNTISQLLKKDIAYFFLQVRDYGYIMGDLYWGSVYSLPYWRYLDKSFLDSTDATFIQNGCLMLVLAICFEKLDGAGNYIDDKLNAIKQAVVACQPDEEDGSELREAVLVALDKIDRGVESDEALFAKSQRVHRRFLEDFLHKIKCGFEF